MFAYLLTALFFLFCLVGVVRDPRRFGNAVLLGLSVLALVVGLLGELHRMPERFADVVKLPLLFLPAVGVLLPAAARWCRTA
ncbi:hypothetical protein [Embleya sp. MST-111070]|uniref:hypothetical protein n=1 Tax=Embleya sp. MST-111070 TaxID=3398231 RepID=UPI003F737529